METMGKKWVFGIGLYLILKGVLNLILGFSVSNIIMLIVGVVALVLMLNRVPYINYIVAVFLAIMFLTHIGANLSNLGSQWITFGNCFSDTILESNIFLIVPLAPGL